MKKIAKVAVGKSTYVQSRRMTAVAMTDYAPSVRRAIYSGGGGGKRVAAVSSAPVISRAVRSTGAANHEGSWETAGVPGVMMPYTSASSRCAARAAAHS